MDISSQELINENSNQITGVYFLIGIFLSTRIVAPYPYLFPLATLFVGALSGFLYGVVGGYHIYIAFSLTKTICFSATTLFLVEIIPWRSLELLDNIHTKKHIEYQLI